MQWTIFYFVAACNFSKTIRNKCELFEVFRVYKDVMCNILLIYRESENDKNWEMYEKEIVSVYKSYVAVHELS